MIYKANDKYNASLRNTYLSGSSTIDVNAIPTNTPTIVVLGYGTEYEAVFSVTGTSGTDAATYALTGVTRLRGYSGNIPANTSVKCMNNEEFFNQYSQFVNDGFLQLEEQATTPATPATGFVKLYVGTDKKWHTVDENGTVATIGELSDSWIDIPSSSNITLDLSNATNKLKFKTTLTSNTTINVSNSSVGQTFLLRLLQDSTGSRTVNWFSTIKWVGGSEPDLTTTANKADTFGFICMDSSPIFDGYIVGQDI